MNDRPRGGFASYVLPAILYSLLIYCISALSAPPAPTYPFAWGDKINHAGAFGLMMLLAFRATRWLMPASATRARLLAALAYCVLYGATDEIHQSMVPDRHADILDWLADTVGALMALGLIMLTIRTRTGRTLLGGVDSR